MAMLSFLDRERTIAPAHYNRWLIPPAALAIHLCIGQVYATSVYKAALVKHFHTSLTAIGVVFSIAIVMLGRLGRGLRHLGRPESARAARCSPPRCCWAAGFLSAAIGISTWQLWLVYFGYGFDRRHRARTSATSRRSRR